MKSTYFCFIFVSLLVLLASPLRPSPLLSRRSTIFRSLSLRETPKERSGYAGETSSFCEAESPEEEAIEISKRSRPRGAIL